MPRSRLDRAKFKTDPLIEQGHEVFVPYTNLRVFESRQVEKSYGFNKEITIQYTKHRMPNPELMKWMETFCGPRGILWTTEKRDDGISIFFAVPKQAMLFKLTWC